MKNTPDRDSDSSQIGSLNIGSVNLSKVMGFQEGANAGNSIMSEHRSRYSMNYQSYEATRIQPGEQTRRMLDYMFPGYQKRDPRNWYEMQTQTDLGWYEVPSLIGTELIEGEPIEINEDKIKSSDDGFGDDFSDFEGPTEKKAAVRKGHRSSVISRVWEGPPIKMSGKSSQEGFHLEVDDFYHEPQTILVPRDVIEHQELKMDIVPDDQGVPKVIIYLGNKEPSDEVVKEPGSTVILYDGKEEFDRASSGSEEEEEAEEEKIEVIPEDKMKITFSNLDLEDTSESEEPTVARDSMEVVPSTVIRVDLESDSDQEPQHSKEEVSDLVLGKGLNSILLEPIHKTGSHDDVFEDVIESMPKLVETPPKEPSPPPKEPTPPPKEPTPPPKELSPPPKEPTPPPKEPTPPPREITPTPPREPTPSPPREPSPSPPREPSPTPPKELTPTPPKEPSPPPKELSPPSLVFSPSPSPSSSVEITPEPPTPVTVSIPSQTNSHIGSPPDRLFGPLDNYPNDLEEESDRVVHTPPKQQLPSPSKDESDDHPLKLTDDYPPQYSPPPREASELSNWLEDNILSEARNLAKKSPKDASPQKPSVSEPPLLKFPQESSVEEVKDLKPELEPMESKTKTKAARFRDDETLPNPRALEERFSIYYPPPKPKKIKVPKEEVAPAVPETDDNLEEEKAVNEWVNDEILAPAEVDNWIDKEIVSKSKKTPSKTSPLPVSKAIPQTESPDIDEESVDAWIDEEIVSKSKEALPKTTHLPVSKAIPQIVVSSESIDSDKERVDAWMDEEILKPAQVDNWVDKNITKPAEKQSASKPVTSLSPERPSPQAPTLPLVTSLPQSISSIPSRTSYASTPSISEPKLIPGLILPAAPSTSPPSTTPPSTSPPSTPPHIVAFQPKERRESSDSIGVNDKDVDSWITNELLEPAQANAWIEKEIVKPTEAQNWVERQIIKPASTFSHPGGEMMKPPAEESFVDDNIEKPQKKQSYVSEESLTPTKAESPPIVESREKSLTKSVSPIKQLSSLQLRPPSPDQLPSTFTLKFPESDDKMPTEPEPPSITELLTPKYSPEKQPSPVKDEIMREEKKPEKYLSDLDMEGPFQPHPDHPGEYPWKMTEEKSDMKALEIPSKQSGIKPLEVTPGTSVEEKPEISLMKLQKPSTIEKSPTMTSLARKPSLKQKSDSESLSKIKPTDVEPEKKDRPSVMARKAIEADNYLLRDEDEDYVKPKISSVSPTTDERRRSSSSKKLASLSNLFKRKRSSQDSQKMPTTKDDETGKIKLKQLPPIEEEDYTPPKVTTFLPSTSGKEADENKRQFETSSGLTEKPVDLFEVSAPTKSTVESQAKTTDETVTFPEKPLVVAPEELFHRFPEFPDHEELMKNQKKPAKFVVKTRPDPPKKGFPEFPDYRQLTEPQTEIPSTDSSPSKEKPLDPNSISQVRSKSEETPKFKERPTDKLDEIQSISVTIDEPSSVQLREPSVPRVASQKVSIRGSPSSNISEPMATLEKRCWSTEPTPPGDGVPRFSDFKEISLGPNEMLRKPQSDTQSRVHQQPASFSDGSPRSQPIGAAQEPTSQQQSQPSGAQVPYVPHAMQMPQNVAQKPTFTPGIASEDSRQDQLLQTPRPQPQPHTSRAYTKPYEETPFSSPSGFTELYGPSKEAYAQTQLKQAPSFKKHDYSQPDKPVQRMSAPMLQTIPRSGKREDLQSQPEYYSPSPAQNQKTKMLEDGSIPPYGGMVGSSMPPLPPSQQKPEIRRLDHSTPQQPPTATPEGYISIKQRGPQQSLGKPYGQVYQQGPGGPYGTAPQNQQTQPYAYSPLGLQDPYGGPMSSYRAPPSAGNLPPSHSNQYGARQNQDPYSDPSTSPYSKPYQYGIPQPATPPYGNYGPFPQASPYGRPYGTPPPTVQQQPSYGVPTTSPYTPRTDQLRTAPDFTPYRPQQAPSTKTKTQKSPGFKKHSYSHPEKPLPLAQTRPRGLEDDDQSPYSSPEKQSSKTGATDNRRISERQTTPIEPGGGVPRFQDFETASEPTAKPPSMTGDFRKSPQKPKTVTAADKRAEFDMEIQPIMRQIADLKRQMYEITPQKGPPLRTGPEHGRPLPTSLQLYNELEKRTLAATKSDREEARADRRKQLYEANARRRIEREIERSKQTKYHFSAKFFVSLKMVGRVLLAALRTSAVAPVKALYQPTRHLSLSPIQRLKEITITKTEKKTIFEAQFKPEPWEAFKLENASPSACSLCATNLDVKHTDVLILSQFVRSDGCMLPRRITGLCKTQQKKVSKMVAMAQKAGLMSNLTPANSKKDPKKRQKWKKFNTYFDEGTITLPREYRKKPQQLLVYV
ncbi:hypothetical protein GE061_013761 [Apolygus lucorum]|uniref:Uncharacterized protein n=1 Tax=Apolygus lucorum TaxID=248454 RepID=A0A6A4KEX6_APOLU|nr:hypothetical protein GE061_013761 [Apolygus lucorum]